MLEIFSQDHFLASGDWDVYAPFPRKNVKRCPNIFIIKQKIFFFVIMYSVYYKDSTSQIIQAIFTMHK